jgi:exopolysaccharide biosynthesis polyprenyl glycosylphosphotransferase
VGLLLGSVPGSDLRARSLAAYVCVVTAAALLERGAVVAVGARSRTRTVRAVLAGHRHGIEGMLEELRTAGSPFTVVAVCVSGRAGADGFDVPALAGLRNLPNAVAEHAADAVIAVPCRHVDPARLRRLGWRLEQTGTPLFVGTGLREVGAGRARVGTAGSLTLIRVQHAALGGARRIAKQVWERVAAATALVVLGPLLLAIAALVRLESPGPALFRQTRVGRGGRTFTMLKLRTMCADAEARLGPLAAAPDREDQVLFKMRDDPRVTRLGRWLRRYSLDELPQLVNVVRGEMALVGPRPPLPREVERYDGDARRRLVVTPGLTGLWQVSGRSDLSWEETVRLDLSYVENWSLGLDLRILVRTVAAVLGHRGAY